MTEGEKKRILIIEDAKGIAHGYRTMLQAAEYDITICYTGVEVKSLIDVGEKFDLAILDIMLPAEDPVRYTLAECQDTGVRLISQMIEKETCWRFYVITVRSSLKDRVERLCEEKKVSLKFEHKLDHAPEKFQENVKSMLAQPVKCLMRNLLLELKEHRDVIDGYAKMINLLSETDKEQLVVSMKSIRKILTRSRNPDFEEVLRRTESVLRSDYLPNAEGVLKKEVERTIASIEEWLKNYTLHL